MADPKFDSWVKGRTPSGRWGKPDDLIGVAVFLASPASAYVNGQVIYVDGGLLAVI
jgi:gluconate 5-dehydrogenase